MSAVFAVKGGNGAPQLFTCMNAAMNAKEERMQRGEVAMVEATVGERTIHFQSGLYIVLGMQWNTLRVFKDREAAVTYRTSLMPMRFSNGAYAYVGTIGDTAITWEML
jgi:Uri superfamily endonuclease